MTHSAMITNKGARTYVTPGQKRVYEILLRTMIISIPSIIASALFLKFALGVPLLEGGADKKIGGALSGKPPSGSGL